MTLTCWPRGFASLLFLGCASGAAANTVYFDFDRATLDQEAIATVEAAAAEYAETGAMSVSIVGHTDTVGSRAYNEALSRRRAEAVAAALAERGVPRDELVLAWRGERDLAVETRDGVREPLNRRAEISLAEPDAAPAPAPAPMAEAPTRFRIGVGPYFGFNLQEDDNSYFAGANVTASYFLTPRIAASAEGAGFYNFDSRDDGWGYRVAAGADYHFADFGLGEGVLPYVGANAGYMAIDGAGGTGGFFAGPEIGVTVLGVDAKLAYDFVEDRDAGEGVISITAGYAFDF